MYMLLRLLFLKLKKKKKRKEKVLAGALRGITLSCYYGQHHQRGLDNV